MPICVAVPRLRPTWRYGRSKFHSLDAHSFPVPAVSVQSCSLMAAPTVEQKFTAADGVFSVEEFGAQVTPYFADRDPHRTYAAYSVAKLDTTGTNAG